VVQTSPSHIGSNHNHNVKFAWQCCKGTCVPSYYFEDLLSSALPGRLNIARQAARYDLALHRIFLGGHLVDGALPATQKKTLPGDLHVMILLNKYQIAIFNFSARK